MLQKVTRLDSVPTAEETVLTTEVPTKESRLYTLLDLSPVCWKGRFRINLCCSPHRFNTLSQTLIHGKECLILLLISQESE